MRLRWIPWHGRHLSQLNHLSDLWHSWRHWWHRQPRHQVMAARLLGLSLLLLIYLPTLLSDTQQAQVQLDQQRQQLRNERGQRPLVVDPLDQVQHYLSAFPPVQQNAADIAAMFHSAQRHDVTLQHGDYQFKRLASLPLVTYSASFPVHGDYRAIRDFTAEVLQALPHAALEELRMSRPGAASAQLDTVVHFNLVYRRP